VNSNPAIPYGYTASTRTFPSYVQDRHLCTIGPTRSGKGARIIVQTLIRCQKSMVVTDPKGQNFAVTGRQRRAMGQAVFVLNPFGLHTGAPWRSPRHRFNPLSVLDISAPNVVAEVRALAQALILTKGRDPYFDDTARDLVSASILHLVHKKGRNATLADVRKIITDIAARGPAGARWLVDMSASPYRFIAQPIGRFKDAEARDISSAINSAITQTSFLDDPAFSHPDTGALMANDFDFTMLKKKPTTVFLILPGHYMESCARFLRIMITSAVNSVTATAGGHPVLMLLDEFARLENLPVLAGSFGFAAGFNLQLWPFVQDLSQLEAVYEKEAMSILANCGLVQFFTPVDMKTADYIQRRGGMRTGTNTSRSYSGLILNRPTGRSVGDARVPLLPTESIMGMSEDQSIVFFAGSHSPVLVGRKPYWEIERLAGLFDTDPYHA